MKRIICIGLFALLHFTVFAGEFEGYIKYGITIDTDGDQQAREELEKFFGTIQYFYYKQGKYRIISNGVWGESIYYPDDNRRYNFDASQGSYRSQDCGQDNPLVFENYESQEQEQEILDYDCNALVLKTHNATILVHYSTKIRINPEWFQNHRLDFMDVISSNTSSIPLKTVYYYGDVTVSIEAKEVKQGQLDEAAFMLRDEIPIDQVPKFEEASEVTENPEHGFLPMPGDLPTTLDQSDLETVVIDRLFRLRLPTMMTISNTNPNDRFTAFKDDETGVEILLWTSPRRNERLDPFCTRQLKEIYRRIANPTLVDDIRLKTNSGLKANVATLLADSPVEGKDIYSLLVVDRMGYYLTAEIFAPEYSVGDQQFILRTMIETVERVWE